MVARAAEKELLLLDGFLRRHLFLLGCRRVCAGSCVGDEKFGRGDQGLKWRRKWAGRAGCRAVKSGYQITERKGRKLGGGRGEVRGGESDFAAALLGIWVVGKNGLQPTEFCSLFELPAEGPGAFGVFAWGLLQVVTAFRAWVHASRDVQSASWLSCRSTAVPCLSSTHLNPSVSSKGWSRSSVHSIFFLLSPHRTCLVSSFHDTLVHLIGTDAANHSQQLLQQVDAITQAAHHVLGSPPQTLSKELREPPQHIISTKNRGHHKHIRSSTSRQSLDSPLGHW